MSFLFESLRELDGERATIASFPQPEEVEFLRCAERKAALKLEAVLKASNDKGPWPEIEPEPRPRAVKWPQPASDLNQADLSDDVSDPPALTGATEAPRKAPSGAQRVVSALRAALPFVELILPLLDGVTDTAASNVPAPQAPASPESLAPQTTEVARIEASIGELKTQHRELRDQVVEQNESLKRVEEHLGMVREATYRNTREQQELIEELKGVGSKFNFLALVALGLLGVSVVIDIALCLHIFNFRL